MADAEHKSVEVIADCDRISEPVPKKLRSSVQSCGPDINQREQISSGDEPGGSCAVEISALPDHTLPEMGLLQAPEGAEGNNNEPVTSELTKEYSNAGKTLISGSGSEREGSWVQRLLTLIALWRIQH